MKKSLKILTLVLSLALICGALVVAAFAADDTTVTGIETKLYWDFNNQPEGTVEITGSNYSITGQPVQGTGYKMYDGNNRQGKIAFNRTTTGSGAESTYFFWSNDHDCGKSACETCGTTSYNGYIAAGISGLNYNGYSVDPDTGIFNGQYNQSGTYNKYDFICEADVWAPAGYNFGGASGTVLKFHTYGVGYKITVDDEGKEKVELKANWVGDLIPGVKMYNDANGAYIALNHGTSASNLYYIDTNSWAHVTLSVNTVVVDDYLDVYATLWVNGDYVATEKIGSTDNGMNLGNTGEGTYSLVNGTDFIFGGDWRLQVTSSYAKTNDSIAADNMMVRQIDRATYTANGGNLYEVIKNKANLSEWDANLYNRADMPYGYTVATNTTTGVQYDNLQYALDAATSGDTIALCKNISTDVVINKELTLKTEGYTTGKVLAGSGLSIFNNDGEYWTESGGTVEIYWGDCECELDICDDTHPGGVTTFVGIGGNIFDSYEAAGKSHNWTYTDEESLTIYKLVGWEDADGVAYTADSVITAAIAENSLLELYPVYSKNTPVYKYFKGGVETYGFADEITLEVALESADEWTTFTFLDDVLALNLYMGGSGIQPKDGVTVDLNGKTLYWIQDGNTNKSPLFQATTNKTLTVTTSQPGAKILSGKMYADKTDASSTQGGAIFVGGNNTTINVDGTKGLEIMSAQLALSDGGSYGTFNITGGTYVQPSRAQDSWAVMQMCCFKELNLKDATFIVFAGSRNIVGTMGNGAAPGADGSKVNIDGCNFIGGVFNRGDFPELVVNVTNSYIQGKIDLTERFTARSGGRDTNGMAGGTWTFGEGCYFGTDVSNSGVTFAEGYNLYNNPTTKEYTYTTNTWTYGNVEESMKLYEDTITVDYTYSTAKEVAPITINWVDAQGNSLGTTEAKPGTVAISPVVSSAADGWVNVSYTAAIPEDATESYTVTVDENTEVKYTAGKVPVYMNYDLVMHFQLNLYIPKTAPEGVTNVAYTRGGTARSFNFNASWVIGGEKMAVGNEWPGAMGADNDYTITITYEYDGQAIEYALPLFNMGDYAKEILNGDYSTEIKQAMLSTLNYVDAANKAATPVQTTSAEVTEAIALAAEKGITVENVTVDTTLENVDYSGISDYIASARLALGQGITIQLVKSAKAIEDDVVIRFTAESGTAYTDGSATSVSTWYWNNTRAYQLNDNVKIEILDGIERNESGKYVAGTGTVVASCDYSVWANAAAIWELPETTDAMKDLVIAALTMGKYVEYII